MTNELDDVSENGAIEQDLAVVCDEFGALVIGDEALIAEFVEEWTDTHGARTIAVPDARTSLIASKVGKAALRTGSPVARYVEGTQLWEQASRPAPGTIVTFHKMTRSSTTGKILSNPELAPIGLVPGLGEVALALVAIETALNQMADRIDAHLDEIEDKVDDILRLASAQRLGDVYGHRRILQRRVKEISERAILTDTDWSSVAALGADLEVGVERLRYHAIQLVSQLRPEESAAKRADQLKVVVKKGMLGETLSLLLVAQQSLYLWQRLRLERTRSTEPDHLEQTVESARTTLREHTDADRELASVLRQLLDRHAALRVTEIHHQFAGRTLSKYRGPLTETVDAFIDARALQVESWAGTENAKVGDAIVAARLRTVAVANSGRRQLSSGASAVARWIEPKSDEASGGEDSGNEEAAAPPTSGAGDGKEL